MKMEFTEEELDMIHQCLKLMEDKARGILAVVSIIDSKIAERL